MALLETLEWLGFKLPDIVAGGLGGVAKALAIPNERPRDAIISCIIGGVTANYFGEFIADKVGIGRGAACFVAGLAAMVICQYCINKVESWTKRDKEKGNE